jgi:hypothetical protein
MLPELLVREALLASPGTRRRTRPVMKKRSDNTKRRWRDIAAIRRRRPTAPRTEEAAESLHSETLRYPLSRQGIS